MCVISLEQNCIPGRILYWIVYFAGKTIYVKRKLMGEFEKEYERKYLLSEWRRVLMICG
jgi:hypothetical protein